MGIKYKTVVRGGIRYYVRAIDDGVVVGRMTGRVVQRPDRGRKQVWVGNIKVHEDRRREGIATGMARTLHKRFPNYVVVHNIIVSYEDAQWAMSLPKRWNLVYIDDGWDPEWMAE